MYGAEKGFLAAVPPVQAAVGVAFFLLAVIDLAVMAMSAALPPHPVAVVLPKTGQALMWSSARTRQGRQKLWPHAMVTGWWRSLRHSTQSRRPEPSHEDADDPPSEPTGEGGAWDGGGGGGGGGRGGPAAARRRRRHWKYARSPCQGDQLPVVAFCRSGHEHPPEATAVTVDDGGRRTASPSKRRGQSSGQARQLGNAPPRRPHSQSHRDARR